MTNKRKKAKHIYNWSFGLFLLTFFCVSYAHVGGGWNQNSRLNLLRAMVFDNTLSIDKYHDNTGDKAIYQNHYYSDKAPGIVFLALPGYLLANTIFSINSEPGWFYISWISTSLSVGLLLALASVFLFLWLKEKIPERLAFFTCLSCIVGSIGFTYAMMLFSHAGTIGLLSIALALCFINSKTPIINSIAIGLLCGFSIIGEYPSSIAACAIFITAISKRKSAMFMLLGLIGPFLLLGTYNLICFDSAFNIGYLNLTSDWTSIEKGPIGFMSKIDAPVIFYLLFSPSKGLLMWSPIFLLYFVGIKNVYQTERLFAIISLIVVFGYCIFLASNQFWDGGGALGPRHLASALPFLILPTAVGVSLYPRIGLFLGLLSIALVTICSQMDPIIMLRPNPLFEYYIPRFFTTESSFNMAKALGINTQLTILIPFLLCLSTYLITHEKTSKLLLWFFAKAKQIRV